MLLWKGSFREAIAACDEAMEQNPDALGILWTRGAAYAHLGQWDKAAADLAPQGVNSVWPNSDFSLQLACLRLLQDDVPGYRQVCQQLIERAGQSKEGITGNNAYMLLRTCTMFPKGGTDPAEVLLWTDRAVASQPKTAWYLHTLALAHYRADHFDQAVHYCHESQKVDPKLAGRIVNQLLLAMAYQRLVQRDEARRTWQEVAQWREAVGRGTYKGDGTFPPDMHLSDWLEFQVLYREAETLIGPDDLNPSKPN